MKNKIAIQGIRGAFHEKAAKKHFGEDIEIVACQTFKDVCDSVKSLSSDFAVMAIENTIAGSLLPNYSLIREYQLKVVGEVYLNIKMNLMTIPGVELSKVEIVESHPIALQQCKEFVYENLEAVLSETYDTAGAARDLEISQRTDMAIIAGEDCASIYNLEIREKGIETNKQNFTRFLILATEGEIEKPNKASLSFQIKHKSGCLVDVLSIFQENDINLTKIQSVPIIGSPYEYNFHVDIEWSKRSNYEKALQKILKKTTAVSLLGAYKKATYKLNNN
jgi:prephenate dehydratase